MEHESRGRRSGIRRDRKGLNLAKKKVAARKSRSRKKKATVKTRGERDSEMGTDSNDTSTESVEPVGNEASSSAVARRPARAGRKPRAKTDRGAAKSASKAPADDIEVTSRDDGVVIRFPPAGVSPFADPQEAGGADTQSAGNADDSRRDAPEPDSRSAQVKEGSSRRRRRVPARTASDEEPTAAVIAFETGEERAASQQGSVPAVQDGAAPASTQQGPEPATSDAKVKLTAASKRRRRRRSSKGQDKQTASPEPVEEAVEGGSEAAPESQPDAAPARTEDEAPPRTEDGAGPARRRRGRRGGRRARRRRGSRDAATHPDDDAGDERDIKTAGGSDEAAEAEFIERDLEEAHGAVREGDLRAEEPAKPTREATPSRIPRDEQAAPTPGTKTMIVNVIPNEECRIAVLENGKLEEIYLERASSENHVGNIYKGRVTNVEPSIQAAFIDFGLSKNGFLHISDLHTQYFPNRAGDSEDIGRKTPRRDRPPIQRCLRRGQELIVQIIKEGIGTKGPTLSTYLSIPGRFLVMLPGMLRVGVSRKIEDPEQRDKLRQQLNELELPEGIGFIARTAAIDRTKRELQTDLHYLQRLWKAVEKRVKSERAPAELYRESDLVIRTIRDVFTSDVSRIVIDDLAVARRARDFLSIFSPRSRDAVIHYDRQEPIFHKYGIENELERLHSRHVPLKSGGSLVIDSTEALVAIDVNSGKFRDEDDAETTAYKINLEAANEIPRQLRLRDLGGVIVCDFIDMRMEKHRREIERTLARNLKEHKERAKVLRMSRFGMIELTRQRQRASLTRSVYQDCHHCRGTGLVKTAESVALDVMRLIQLAATRDHIATIEVSVSSEGAYLLQNKKRAVLHELESRNNRSIFIKPMPNYGLDQYQIQYFDSRGRVVPVG